MNTEICCVLFWYSRVYLVYNYSFNVCTCAETKHMQLRKSHDSKEVSCFVLLVFKACRSENEQ